MIKAIFSFLILISAFTMGAQSIPVMNYTQLEKHLKNDENKVVLVNFWATWCKPCVEELPSFLRLSEELKDKNFKLVLVSLDFSNQIEKRVMPFVKEHNIKDTVIVLDDPDANSWINKVHPSWDGAIPVSLILYKEKKEFYEGTLNFEELSNLILPKLNK
jgi:thiol-disulfide isomerase/thioredoxin